jgi:prevent-host-death family protein
MKSMGAAEAKTHFLSVLKDVEFKRESIVVTKNGRPVAKVVPLELPNAEDPLDAFYFGKIEIVGDILAPLYSDTEWDEFVEASAAQLK